MSSSIPVAKNGTPIFPVNSSVTWDNGFGGTAAAIKVTKVLVDHASHAALNAAATTDSGNLYIQPANSILLGAYYRLDEQFAATGLTDLDVEVGLSGDNNGLLAATGNLKSDAVGTYYRTIGAYGVPLYEAAATTWVLYVTATGANLSTLTAGTISFYFITLETS